jgi:hypothetical protein
MLLTIGVIVAAWSDQQSKVRGAIILGWILANKSCRKT